MDMLNITIKHGRKRRSFYSLTDLESAAKIYNIGNWKIAFIYNVYMDTSSTLKLLRDEYDIEITQLNTYFKGITVDLFLKFIQKYNLNWLIRFEKLCPKDIGNLLIDPNKIAHFEELLHKYSMDNATSYEDYFNDWMKTDLCIIKSYMLNLKELKISFLSLDTLDRHRYAFLLKWGFLCPIKRRKWLIQMIIDDQLY